MPVYVVLLGPPGAGKGTQAQAISEKLALTHVSSGDIFRENIKQSTELGALAKSYMDKGELVPDALTIAMIQERLTRPDCANGALLDGFPRTVAQAIALEEMLSGLHGQVNVVPYIKVAEEILVERLGGRWTCRAEGHVYHQLFNPPKQSGVCDVDGSDLYQRDDDKAETVSRRIRVYMNQTAPLIAHYQEQGKLLEVDGSQAIEKVTGELLMGLGARI